MTVDEVLSWRGAKVAEQAGFDIAKLELASEQGILVKEIYLSK